MEDTIARYPKAQKNVDTALRLHYVMREKMKLFGLIPIWNIVTKLITVLSVVTKQKQKLKHIKNYEK